MYTNFQALPFVARRALLAVVLVLLAWFALQFPRNEVSETVFFASATGAIWAIGILIPFLKVIFYICKVALRVHASKW
ncbi:hypothetical protein [Caballeronia sp. LZ043]|uniref:hypothetical protein n=1 Tax=Caballeronia sp. LZ043 TaxID=3038569 RepID=UPI00285FAE7C|nr:hypothetical protein [Caballeronia sp. LZ043]MDR5826022.1 hypothetical protein [Caballeronia sp. LZ043]